jgi:hypothetical protein
VRPLSAFWIITLMVSLSWRMIGPTSLAIRASSYMADNTPITTTT